jgi:hypothetical protein
VGVQGQENPGALDRLHGIALVVKGHVFQADLQGQRV